MTHGIASLASVGLLKEDSDENIISMLQNAGGDLIEAAFIESKDSMK